MPDANNNAPKTREEVLREYAFKPGQVANPKGRPKGARSKLGEDFLKALHADFDVHGKEAIVAMREKNPTDYVKVVASILPKEFEASDETINVLSEVLARVDGRTRAVGPAEAVAPETMQ